MYPPFPTTTQFPWDVPVTRLYEVIPGIASVSPHSIPSKLVRTPCVSRNAIKVLMWNATSLWSCALLLWVHVSPSMLDDRYLLACGVATQTPAPYAMPESLPVKFVPENLVQVVPSVLVTWWFLYE